MQPLDVTGTKYYTIGTFYVCPDYVTLGAFKVPPPLQNLKIKFKAGIASAKSGYYRPSR